jgi:hypothetical protein
LLKLVKNVFALRAGATAVMNAKQEMGRSGELDPGRYDSCVIGERIAGVPLRSGGA